MQKNTPPNRRLVQAGLPSLFALTILSIGQPAPAQPQQVPTGQQAPTRQPSPATQSIWKLFSSSVGKFSILMPGTPIERRQPQSGEVQSMSYSVEREGEAAYLVTYSDFPSELILRTDPNQLFDGGRDEALKRAKGTLISERSVNLNGFPGRDLKIEAPQGLIIHNRIYLVNQRMYQIIVVSPGTKARFLTKSIEGYLSSFKLL